MNVDLISEFIKEYTKFFNDIKKRITMISINLLNHV